MPRGTRATGTFQQRELREKLLRLEQEIARSRAAAEEASRQAEARLQKTRESLASVASTGSGPQPSAKVQGRDEGTKG